MRDDSAFNVWLHTISPASFDEGALITDAWLRWLRSVHDAEVSLTRDEVEQRAKSEVRAAVELALRHVLDDVERLHGIRPNMELSDHDGLRVAYVSEGSFATGPPEGLLVSPSQVDVTVAVSDAVFDLLAEEWLKVPFVCDRHQGSHLVPRAVGERATWWCDSGQHVAAEVGQLTPLARS